MRLQGKNALITGAASGIGHAIASRFGAEGAAVYLCDTSSEALEKTLADLQSRGVRAFGDVGDVSRGTDAARLATRAWEAMSRIDILVNNAGIGTLGSLEGTSDADWERVLAVNLGGVYHVSRAVIPYIKRAGGGAIVNLSSLAALMSCPGVAAYGASKAAVLQLTRTMAAELAGDHIRVNCVCPGQIDTPMLWRTFRTFSPERPEAIRDELLKRVLTRRLGRPEEIAACVLFLASDDASFVNGQALVADGGFSIT